MHSVRISVIPEYLRQGDLFHSLIENDEDPNEELTFPISVLKPDVTVHCENDCNQLLNSLKFWGVVHYIPKELVDFVLSAPVAKCSSVLQKHEAHLVYLKPLRLMAAEADGIRIKIAIASNILELVEGAARRACTIPHIACDLAAAAGNVEVMKCLQKYGCIFDHSSVNIAARNGQGNMLKYLHEQGLEVTVESLEAAAEGGHLECVKDMFPLLSAQTHRAEHATVVTACKHEGVSLLHCLESKIDWSRHSCLNAAEAGNLECLKFLHEHGCLWDRQTTYYAATNGHLNCLQYAHERGCPIESQRASFFAYDNPCKAYFAQHGFLQI